MNNWLVALIVWAIFAAILIIADHTCAINFTETWLYIVLTAPLTIPAMAVIFPCALCVKLFRCFHLKNRFPFIYFSKWY